MKSMELLNIYLFNIIINYILYRNKRQTEKQTWMNGDKAKYILVIGQYGHLLVFFVPSS